MKSCRVLRDSFGHIFPFFGTCFAHAASLNCLLHALAFHFLIQCIIDAHLAAKIQLLCVACCLRAAPRDELCHHGVRRCHRGGGHCHNTGGLSTVPAACWGWPGLPEHPREKLGSVASGGVCLYHFVLPPKMVPVLSLSLPKFLVFPFIV